MSADPKCIGVLRSDLLRQGRSTSDESPTFDRDQHAMRHGVLHGDLSSPIQSGLDPASQAQTRRGGERVRLLCVGGEDHGLRIPFLRDLQSRGFDVHAAGTCEPDEFEASGIAFHRYDFARRFDPVGDWRALGALGAIIRAVQPDVVQSFDTKPNLYLALLSPRLPTTRIVRTINGTGRVHSSGSAAARCLRPIYNLVQRQATRAQAATVFQNEADKAFFERKGMAYPGTARLIPGSGVDVEALDRVRATAIDPARLREQLGLTAPRLVITVTRIEPLKGIRTLLAAAEIVHRVDPETQFVLVGPWEDAGPADSDLRDLCRRSPAIRWIGPRTDIQALLASADVFVFPTEFREGLPRVLLEAALASLPIVTTDMPGCMSVVQHGQTGLVVPPRAPGALAAAILEILASPERGRAMGARGSERIRRDFSLARISQQYAHLYEDLTRRLTPAGSA